MSSMGVALREIGGRERVQVVTRLTESTVMQFQREEGAKPEAMAGSQFFTFNAVSYREIGNDDVWEFRVLEMSPAGPMPMYVYMRGEDVFWVKRAAQIDVG